MRQRSLGTSGLLVPEVGMDAGAPIRAGLDEDAAVALLHHPDPDELARDELPEFLTGQVAAGKLRAWGAAFTPAPAGAPEAPHPEEPGQAALRELRLPAVAVRYNLASQDPGRALLDAA